MRILIVEAKKELSDALRQTMSAADYRADFADDGRDGLSLAMSGTYDVIVLNVALPGLNGFEVTRRLREANIDTPLLLLAECSDTKSEIRGLDQGADDYLTGPLIPEKLLARIRALARRRGEITMENLHFADLTLALCTNDLSCGEKTIHLCCKEFQILQILMTSSPMLVSKESLIERVWKPASGAADNNVEAYISLLRRKFRDLDSAVTVETVRKVGYRLKN